MFSLFLCLKIVVKATTFKAQLLCPKKAVTPFKKLYKQTLKSTSWKSILVEFLKTHCFQMDLTKVYSGPYFIMCLDKEGLPSLLIACLGLKRTVHMWWLNLLYGKCYAILASVWFFEKYQNGANIEFWSSPQAKTWELTVLPLVSCMLYIWSTELIF